MKSAGRQALQGHVVRLRRKEELFQQPTNKCYVVKVCIYTVNASSGCRIFTYASSAVPSYAEAARACKTEMSTVDAFVRHQGRARQQYDNDNDW